MERRHPRRRARGDAHHHRPGDVRRTVRSATAGPAGTERFHRPRQPRQLTTSVAGYDLTFTPVKSVSALWAIAPVEVSKRIEAAHHQAVADALEYLQAHAAFTRTGADGVAQVDTTDSSPPLFDPPRHPRRRPRPAQPRRGVQQGPRHRRRRRPPLAGPGRAGRCSGATVAASELYNTRLEGYLGERARRAVRRTRRPRPRQAAGARNRRRPHRTDQPVVVAARRHRPALRRAGQAVSDRARARTHHRRGDRADPAGHPGNPASQTRTPLAGRAAPGVAHPGDRAARQPGSAVAVCSAR